MVGFYFQNKYEDFFIQMDKINVEGNYNPNSDQTEMDTEISSEYNANNSINSD